MRLKTNIEINFCDNKRKREISVKMLFKGNSSRLELLIGKIQAHKDPQSPSRDDKCNIKEKGLFPKNKGNLIIKYKIYF